MNTVNKASIGKLHHEKRRISKVHGLIKSESGDLTTTNPRTSGYVPIE